MNIKLKIKNLIRKLNKDQQKEIDSLNYIINSYLDITKFPKATGDLRILQEADVLLLVILDLALKKHNIDMWLDSGTLLGALRHGGFIPWDDDTDVCVSRKDFNKLKSVLTPELDRFGITVDELENGERVCVSYNHTENGTWIDIFPVDYCTDTASDDPKLLSDYAKFRKGIKRLEKKEKIEPVRNKVFKDITDDETNAKTAIFYMEFNYELNALGTESIFPLSTIAFEGHQFNAPKDIDAYLKMLYGDSYMCFPKDASPHHDFGRGPLSGWAKKNNIDMNDIIKHFEEAIKVLENEV